MTNVDRIAALRGISSSEAIAFWKHVCDAAGLELSTYELLTALLAQGERTTSISADQLGEQRKQQEAEKRRREEELQAAEAARLKELADQRAARERAEVERHKAIAEERAAVKKSEAARHQAIRDQEAAQERIEEEEFCQLVAEMSALNYKRSNQVSAYIVRKKLGFKYKNISGLLEMELEGRRWNFNGGFPTKIYARLCDVLGLGNQGSRATPVAFTPYKDIIKHSQKRAVAGAVHYEKLFSSLF